MAKKKTKEIDTTGMSARDKINSTLTNKFGKTILSSKIKGRLETNWPMFNLFAPIELGTSVLIFGPSQSGKSVMLMKLGAAAQQKGGLFILFNTEGANRDQEFIDKAVPELKFNDILPYQPDDIETLFDSINTIVDSIDEDAPPVFIGVDSISTSATKRELENSVETTNMEGAIIAKIIRAGFRQLTSKLSKKPIVLCVLSQETSTIGYISKKVATGGGAANFCASTTLYAISNRVLYKDAEGEYVDKPKHTIQPAAGRRCSLRSLKSRFSPGNNMLEYIIDYETGINKNDGLLDYAVYRGIITQSGSWYCYGEDKFYKKDFNKFVENFPKLIKEISVKGHLV